MREVAPSERPDGSPLDDAGGNAHLSISAAPVKRIRPDDGSGGDGARFGAVTEFTGVVRGLEAGLEIRGIDYSAYGPMAELELGRIAREGTRRFGEHRLWVHHVTGFVPAGRASLLIRVAARHSPEAFEACRWYLTRVKEALPVWKRPVYRQPEDRVDLPTTGGRPGPSGG